MAQFIHTRAVWGNGGRAPGAARSGGTPGASTWAESRWDGVDWAYTVNTGDWPRPNGQTAATTAKGNQALKTTAFTLTVANGGTAGFEPSGHLLVDTVSNGTQLVAYTGVNAATNAFTGCTAPANAGTAGDGANVKQASTVVGAPALTQTPFTLNVSKKRHAGFCAHRNAARDQFHKCEAADPLHGARRGRLRGMRGASARRGEGCSGCRRDASNARGQRRHIAQFDCSVISPGASAGASLRRIVRATHR